MAYTEEQLSSMYCEDYDDQDGMDFTVVSCEVNGVFKAIEQIGVDLVKQVYELRRRYGKNAKICVYK